MGNPTCDECGASAAIKPCAEHFSELLALDHSRIQPYAGHHGLNVACYLLQHPPLCPDSAVPVQWLLVTTFVRDGLGATQQLERDAVRRNSHRRSQAPHADVTPVPQRPTAPFSVGIEDVSVDGSFPPDGYELRMRRWAEAVVGLEDTFSMNPGRSAWPVHLFLSTSGTRTGVADRSDPAEQVRLVRMTLAELDQLIAGGEIVDPALLVARAVAAASGLLPPLGLEGTARSIGVAIVD